MNPPGTRTAIPTTRRSNSTAKRCVDTIRLLTSARLRAVVLTGAVADRSSVENSGKAPAAKRSAVHEENAPGAARLAGGRQGPRVVRCCSRDGAATVRTENAQSWLRYGSPRWIKGRRQRLVTSCARRAESTMVHQSSAQPTGTAICCRPPTAICPRAFAPCLFRQCGAASRPPARIVLSCLSSAARRPDQVGCDMQAMPNARDHAFIDPGGVDQIGRIRKFGAFGHQLQTTFLEERLEPPPSGNSRCRLARAYNRAPAVHN